jgi:hypothetical protein
LHPAGTDDKKLFEDAQARGAIFLTTDKDFFDTVPYFVSDRKTPVVANSVNITSRLEALLSSVPLESEIDSVFLVTDRKILKRK